MITPFNMVRDINGYNGFGLKFSNYQIQTVLLPNTEITLSVPTTGNAIFKNLLAIFSFTPGSSVWVAINGTATLPSSGVWTQCDCELNPAARSAKYTENDLYLQTGDTLSFITSESGVQVGVTFYATS